MIAQALLAVLVAFPADTPSWADVAPIVHQRCAGCHHATGPAPFPLITRRDVERRARFVAQLIERGLMPPWLPDDQGLPLRGDNRLLPDEKARLLAWLASDRAADGSPDVPPPPRDDAPPPADRVLSMERAWTIPAEGPPDMRSFVLALGNDEPLRVRGIGYRARSPQAVHSVTLLADRHGVGRRMDAGTPPAGYDSMGDSGAEVSGMTGGIGPGLPWLELPPGYAWELPPDVDLIAEVHFVPRGRPEPLQDEVHLYLSDDERARPVAGLWLADIEIDVAPGEAAHLLDDEIVLPFGFEILAILPRAGAVCVALELTAATAGGQPTTLLSIPRWDPHYRRPYVLEQPLRVPPGTRLSATWVLDNSADNAGNPTSPPRRVRLGSEITDEYVSFLLLGAPVAPATRQDVDDFLLASARARIAARKGR